MKKVVFSLLLALGQQCFAINKPVLITGLTIGGVGIATIVAGAIIAGINRTRTVYCDGNSPYSELISQEHTCLFPICTKYGCTFIPTTCTAYYCRNPNTGETITAPERVAFGQNYWPGIWTIVAGGGALAVGAVTAILGCIVESSSY